MTNHWDRTRRTNRWHRLWLDHLQAQRGLNPHHPADATEHKRYETSAQRYWAGTDGDRKLWDDQADREEQTTRHDLVAALNVFNGNARGSHAHLGLTSCDITDVANQMAIADALHGLLADALGLVRVLDATMLEHRDLRLVARTHGQPAQLTTYGHRIATVLEPLVDWVRRADHALQEYPMRPPYGAVGTAADLTRVLTGWQPDGDAPAGYLGGQRSDSEGSPGMSAPPGAPEGTGGAPGRLIELLGAATKGMGRFEQAALDAHRHGHRVWMTVDLDAGSHLMMETETGSLQTFRIDTPPPSVPQDVVPTHQSLTDQKYPNALISDQSKTDVRGSSTDSGPYNPAQLVDVYTAQIAAKTGFDRVMDATRQMYHRSHDLHIAALLAELASIGQTWATDRRLESMLGLGTETPSNGQVGSSAMPHKDNPRYVERMCALAVVTRCYLSASAETAGMEWLEGDVSTSAARRIILPGMFDAATRLVADWYQVAASWTVNESAVTNEALTYEWQMATGALLFEAVEAGSPRRRAHEAIRVAWQQDGVRAKLAQLATTPGWPLSMEQMRNLLARVMSGPIGNVAAQIDQVHLNSTRVLDGDTGG